MKAAVTLLFPFLTVVCLCAHAQDSLESDDVTVVFPGHLRLQADATLELYRRAARQVRDRTGLPDPGRVRIELAGTNAAFNAAYSRLGGRDAPEHALAVAFSPRNIILVDSSRLSAIGPGSLPETLVHETFHLYLGSMMQKTNMQVPLWFNEGLAQWTAGQKLSNRLRNMLETDAKGRHLPPLSALSGSFPKDEPGSSIAYAYSLSFVEWLEEQRPGIIRRILAALGNRKPFTVALRETAGESLPELERAHTAELAARQSFLRTFLTQLTLFSILSLIALAAFVRYLIKRRRLRRELDREDMLDDFYG